jgi:hypothetical protein
MNNRQHSQWEVPLVLEITTQTSVHQKCRPLRPPSNKFNKFTAKGSRALAYSMLSMNSGCPPWQMDFDGHKSLIQHQFCLCLGQIVDDNRTAIGRSAKDSNAKNDAQGEGWWVDSTPSEHLE